MTRRLLVPWLPLLLTCACSAALLGAVQAAPPQLSYPSDAGRYALSITAPRSLEATLDFEIRAAQFQAGNWDIFAAQPPTLATQTATSVRLTAGGKPYREPAPPHRALVRAEIDASEAQRARDVRPLGRQRHQRQRRHRLAGARFADHAEAVAGVEREGDVMDDAARAGGRGQIDGESGDFEQHVSPAP